MTAITTLLALVLTLLTPTTAPCAASLQHMFGFQEMAQAEMTNLPQWLNALERHITQDVPDGDCKDSFFNRCHLQRWHNFLDSIKDLPAREQIDKVNLYANTKQYVLDMDNYGLEDYWAVAREFLYDGGDCEDYAVTKFFSLRWLGFQNDDIRIVILQDTNLRVPHAVLAVGIDNDVLIMDNQSQEVLSHRRIAHYIPLYSVNEQNWWLHMPPFF
jgi:predicted transglutaminase-like cysteine proteinase